MAERDAPIAIDPSGARGCRARRRGGSRRRRAPTGPDRLARLRPAASPAARQRPRRDAEIVYGEVSWRPLSFQVRCSILSVVVPHGIAALTNSVRTRRQTIVDAGISG